MTDKEILEYVKTWLNDNLDNEYPEDVVEDSYHLLEKINEMQGK